MKRPVYRTQAHTHTHLHAVTQNYFSQHTVEHQNCLVAVLIVTNRRN